MFTLLKTKLIRKNAKYSGRPKSPHTERLIVTSIDESNVFRYIELLEICIKKKLKGDEKINLKAADTIEIDLLVDKFMSDVTTREDIEQWDISTTWIVISHVIKASDPIFSYDNAATMEYAMEDELEIIASHCPLPHQQFIGALLSATEIMLRSVDPSTAESIIRSVADVLFWSIPPHSLGTLRALKNLGNLKSKHFPYCHTFARKLGTKVEYSAEDWIQVIERIDPRVRWDSRSDSMISMTGLDKEGKESVSARRMMPMRQSSIKATKEHYRRKTLLREQGIDPENSQAVQEYYANNVIQASPSQRSDSFSMEEGAGAGAVKNEDIMQVTTPLKDSDLGIVEKENVQSADDNEVVGTSRPWRSRLEEELPLNDVNASININNRNSYAAAAGNEKAPFGWQQQTQRDDEAIQSQQEEAEDNSDTSEEDNEEEKGMTRNNDSLRSLHSEDIEEMSLTDRRTTMENTRANAGGLHSNGNSSDDASSSNWDDDDDDFSEGSPGRRIRKGSNTRRGWNDSSKRRKNGGTNEEEDILNIPQLEASAKSSTKTNIKPKSVAVGASGGWQSAGDRALFALGDTEGKLRSSFDSDSESDDNENKEQSPSTSLNQNDETDFLYNRQGSIGSTKANEELSNLHPRWKDDHMTTGTSTTFRHPEMSHGFSKDSLISNSFDDESQEGHEDSTKIEDEEVVEPMKGPAVEIIGSNMPKKSKNMFSLTTIDSSPMTSPTQSPQKNAASFDSSKFSEEAANVFDNEATETGSVGTANSERNDPTARSDAGSAVATSISGLSDGTKKKKGVFSKLKNKVLGKKKTSTDTDAASDSVATDTRSDIGDQLEQEHDHRLDTSSVGGSTIASGSKSEEKKKKGMMSKLKHTVLGKKKKDSPEDAADTKSVTSADAAVDGTQQGTNIDESNEIASVEGSAVASTSGSVGKKKKSVFSKIKKTVLGRKPVNSDAETASQGAESELQEDLRHTDTHSDMGDATDGAISEIASTAGSVSSSGQRKRKSVLSKIRKTVLGRKAPSKDAEDAPMNDSDPASPRDSLEVPDAMIGQDINDVPASDGERDDSGQDSKGTPAEEVIIPAKVKSKTGIFSKVRRSFRSKSNDDTDQDDTASDNGSGKEPVAAADETADDVVKNELPPIKRSDSIVSTASAGIADVDNEEMQRASSNVKKIKKHKIPGVGTLAKLTRSLRGKSPSASETKSDVGSVDDVDEEHGDATASPNDPATVDNEQEGAVSNSCSSLTTVQLDGDEVIAPNSHQEANTSDAAPGQQLQKQSSLGAFLAGSVDFDSKSADIPSGPVEASTEPSKSNKNVSGAPAKKPRSMFGSLLSSFSKEPTAGSKSEGTTAKSQEPSSDASRSSASNPTAQKSKIGDRDVISASRTSSNTQVKEDTPRFPTNGAGLAARLRQISAPSKVKSPPTKVEVTEDSDVTQEAINDPDAPSSTRLSAMLKNLHKKEKKPYAAYEHALDDKGVKPVEKDNAAVVRTPESIFNEIQEVNKRAKLRNASPSYIQQLHDEEALQELARSWRLIVNRRDPIRMTVTAEEMDEMRSVASSMRSESLQRRLEKQRKKDDLSHARLKREHSQVADPFFALKLPSASGRKINLRPNSTATSTGLRLADDNMTPPQVQSQLNDGDIARLSVEEIDQMISDNIFYSELELAMGIKYATAVQVSAATGWKQRFFVLMVEPKLNPNVGYSRALLDLSKRITQTVDRMNLSTASAPVSAPRVQQPSETNPVASSPLPSPSPPVMLHRFRQHADGIAIENKNDGDDKEPKQDRPLQSQSIPPKKGMSMGAFAALAVASKLKARSHDDRSRLTQTSVAPPITSNTTKSIHDVSLPQECSNNTVVSSIALRSAVSSSSNNSNKQPEYYLLEYAKNVESKWGMVPNKLIGIYPLKHIISIMNESNPKKKGLEFTLMFRIPSDLASVGVDEDVDEKLNQQQLEEDGNEELVDDEPTQLPEDHSVDGKQQKEQEDQPNPSDLPSSEVNDDDNHSLSGSSISRRRNRRRWVAPTQEALTELKQEENLQSDDVSSIGGEGVEDQQDAAVEATESLHNEDNHTIETDAEQQFYYRQGTFHGKDQPDLESIVTKGRNKRKVRKVKTELQLKCKVSTPDERLQWVQLLQSVSPSTVHTNNTIY